MRTYANSVADLDPADFFSQLAVLITEARIPDPSKKGRVEGPHCPVLSDAGLNTAEPHLCKATDSRCMNALDLVCEAKRLWAETIPLSIEVLLVPVHCSEQHRCLIRAYLLETWTLYSHTKRVISEKVLPPAFLLQAVRSQLHFSQLSAWLSSQRGHLPFKIAYRVCIPGESECCLLNQGESNISGEPLKSHRDSQKLTNHKFPTCLIGDSVLISVDVTSPAERRDNLPQIQHCLCNTHGSGRQLQPGARPDLDLVVHNDRSGEPECCDCRNPLVSLSSQNAYSEQDEQHGLKERLEALQVQVSRLSTRLRSLSVGNAAGFHQHPTGLLSTPPKPLDSRPTTLAPPPPPPLFTISPPNSPRSPSSPDYLAKVMWYPNPQKLKSPKGNKAARILFTEPEQGVFLSEHGAETFADVIATSTSDVTTAGGVVKCFPPPQSVSADETKMPATSIQFQGFKSSPSKEATITTTKLTRSKGLQKFHTFNRSTGLPLSSSPAPLKRNQYSFDFDSALTSVTGLKHAFHHHEYESSSDSECGTSLCKSAPESSSNLLGNFEESALNGRIKPFGSVEGFCIELAASGAFCSPHIRLPLTTFFFNVSEDNAPSPYLTLFNPHGTVVKMFVVKYDLSDMPGSAQTFVRQRTFYMPTNVELKSAFANRAWLRYLIHLRFATSRSCKLYLHTDIRMLFSRKSEMDAGVAASPVDKCQMTPGQPPEPKGQKLLSSVEKSAEPSTILLSGPPFPASPTNCENFELRSFTEMPKNPKFSPRKK